MKVLKHKQFIHHADLLHFPSHPFTVDISRRSASRVWRATVTNDRVEGWLAKLECRRSQFDCDKSYFLLAHFVGEARSVKESRARAYAAMVDDAVGITSDVTSRAPACGH